MYSVVNFSVLTEEEVLPHRNWTSWIKEK